MIGSIVALVGLRQKYPQTLAAAGRRLRRADEHNPTVASNQRSAVTSRPGSASQRLSATGA
jgi:hypothetical protein